MSHRSSTLSSISSVPPSSVAPTSSPPATTSLQDVTSTGSNGVVHTYTDTQVFTASGSAEPSQTAPVAADHKTSFLQNKALSGTVFALVGILGLILIIVAATFVLRRRARNRLLDDAVSFDPGLLAAANNAEKGHSSNASLGTLGSGRPVPSYGTYRAEPVQQYPEYYGAAQNAQQSYYPNAQQPYYSAYVPPMADVPPPSAVGGSAFTSQTPQHNIPRVPVPAGHLPNEFGSSSDHRRSTEESEFWARTLQVSLIGFWINACLVTDDGPGH